MKSKWQTPKYWWCISPISMPTRIGQLEHRTSTTVVAPKVVIFFPPIPSAFCYHSSIILPWMYNTLRDSTLLLTFFGFDWVENWGRTLPQPTTCSFWLKYINAQFPIEYWNFIFIKSVAGSYSDSLCTACAPPMHFQVLLKRKSTWLLRVAWAHLCK